MRGDALVFTGAILREGPRRYAGLCLELDVASQGRTVPEARRMLAEAVQLYIESAVEANLPYLRPVPPGEDPVRNASPDLVETFPVRVRIAVSASA